MDCVVSVCPSFQFPLPLSLHLQILLRTKIPVDSNNEPDRWWTALFLLGFLLLPVRLSATVYRRSSLLPSAYTYLPVAVRTSKIDTTNRCKIRLAFFSSPRRFCYIEVFSTPLMSLLFLLGGRVFFGWTSASYTKKFCSASVVVIRCRW